MLLHDHAYGQQGKTKRAGVQQQIDLFFIFFIFHFFHCLKLTFSANYRITVTL